MTIKHVVPAEPWRHRFVEPVFSDDHECIELRESAVIAWMVDIDYEGGTSVRPIGLHNANHFAVLDIRRKVYVIPNYGDFETADALKMHFTKVVNAP